MRHQLTQSSPLHFVCRDAEDSQYLDHNINDYGPHGRSRCDTSVYLKPAKELLNAVKEFNELVLARPGIFSRLGAMGVRNGRKKEPRRTLTKRRTPIPAKIAFAGGNA